MKQTYTNKHYDFGLIAFSLFFFVDSVVSLFDTFDYFSSYLLRIIWALFSGVSLISLLSPKLNGERYSRFFIIINLIVPPTLVLAQFVIDLFFYGAIRADLLQNPGLYIKLTMGTILFVLSIRLSREQESNRIKDYGILTILIGIFVVVFTLLLNVDSNVKSFTDMAFVIKMIIGLLITFLGVRLKSEKIKFKTFLILLLILAFIGRI